MKNIIRHFLWKFHVVIWTKAEIKRIQGLENLAKAAVELTKHVGYATELAGYDQQKHISYVSLHGIDAYDYEYADFADSHLRKACADIYEILDELNMLQS